MHRAERKFPWVATVGIGCGVLILLVLALTVGIVVTNWDHISSTAESASSAVKDMFKIQAELRSRYGAQQVRTLVNNPHDERTSTFVVELVNAQGLADLTDAQLRDEALKIAVTAMRLLARPEYARYEVVFVRSGAGIALRSENSFRFARAELEAGAPPTERPDAGPGE